MGPNLFDSVLKSGELFRLCEETASKRLRLEVYHLRRSLYVILAHHQEHSIIYRGLSSSLGLLVRY